MRWDRSLEDDFRRLALESDRQARGNEFENLIGRLFRESGFRIYHNAGAARPRQTDLFASRGTKNLLIEAKWRKASAGSTEIDDLRSRLRRVPATVVGVFFSVGGFTQEAVREVEANRSQVILLFDEYEITRLFRGELSLGPLIDAKIEHLTVHGRAFFEVSDGKWSAHPWPDLSGLPSADTYLWDPVEGSLPWKTYPGGFGHVVFTERLPDVDWFPAPGSGSSFNLDLRIDTLKDVAHVFDVLNQVGWLSPAGRFCIQQSHDYWYGAGPDACWAAIRTFDSRYATAKGPFHHTEEVTYFDMFADGFFVFSFDIHIGDPCRIGDAELSSQLYGVPLDTTDLHQLSQLLHLGRSVYFRPLHRDVVRTVPRWPGRSIQLKPISFLRSKRDDWVCGIIAHNPFFGGEHLDQINPEVRDYLYPLQDLGVVPFRLGQWHEVGDDMSYCLRGLAATSTGEAFVFSMIADSVDRKAAAPRPRRNKRIRSQR